MVIFHSYVSLPGRVCWSLFMKLIPQFVVMACEKRGWHKGPKWACWKSVSSRVCSLTKMLIKTNYDHNHHNRYNPTHPISGQKSASSHPHPICCCHLSQKKPETPRYPWPPTIPARRIRAKPPVLCTLAELVRNKGNISIHSHNFPIVGMSQYLLLYIYDLYWLYLYIYI